MLKESLKVIAITFIISFLVIYLTISFTILDFKIITWTNFERGVLALTPLIITIGIGIKYVIYLANKS